jgi:preprotein translocase subunit SecE
MAKLSDGTFLGELCTLEIYKRNQGRLVRQLTFAGLALVLGVGVVRLAQTWLTEFDAYLRVLTGAIIFIGGAWVIYRLVNFPRFADFLISVETEVDKVSWPSRTELYRSTVVVIMTMVALSVVLSAFDVFWVKLLKLIGVLV